LLVGDGASPRGGDLGGAELPAQAAGRALQLGDPAGVGVALVPDQALQLLGGRDTGRAERVEQPRVACA
jgi:hypothetical protein